MEVAVLSAPKAIYGAIAAIVKLAANAKSYKNNWRRLSDRVTHLRGLVQSLECQHINSAAVWNARWELGKVLTEAERLSEKSSTINPFKISKRKKQLDDLTKRLNHTFEALSAALHAEPGSTRQEHRPTLYFNPSYQVTRYRDRGRDDEGLVPGMYNMEIHVIFERQSRYRLT